MKCNILSLGCPRHRVTERGHIVDEILFTAAVLHCGFDIIHQLKLPTITLCRRAVLPRRHFQSAFLVWFKHRVAAAFTYFIAQLPQISQSIWALPELQTVFKINGINYKMRMDMFAVTVSRYHNLVTFPCFFRELQSNFVSLLGRNIFFGRE